MNSLGHFLHFLDEFRRTMGRGLEAGGIRPQPTPSHAVYGTGTAVLQHYGGADTDAPVVLLVPAPIKKSYIWDMTPTTSVVRRVLEAGFNVYLLDWQEPGPEHQNFGLDAYADSLIEQCMAYIDSTQGTSQTFLIGHSLGGILSAIYSALHPSRVRGLVLLEAPIAFEEDSGPVKAVATASLPAFSLTDQVGNVPGISMNGLGVLAAPGEFIGERSRDFLRSLSTPDAFFRHMLVERWTLDETALPKRLFEEVTEDLCRNNLFCRGELIVNGKFALPRNVAAPLLSVACPHSRIIPPSTMTKFHQITSSTERRILFYEGDVGVTLQHVGVLVGNDAHQQLWPEITQWLNTQ